MLFVLGVFAGSFLFLSFKAGEAATANSADT